MSAARELPTIWQIGTGDESRPYHQWMIDHQIALIGSSWAGRWPNDDYGKAPAIRCFAEDAKAADLVVAKRGLYRALAVGVLGPYDFSDALDDIEGWDMGHFRRVRWLSTTPYTFSAPVLAQSRFARCGTEAVHRWVRRTVAGMSLDPPDPRRLLRLPDPGPALDRAALVPELRAVIERAASWHRHTYGGGFGVHPAECELISHVTVPLLAALGWPPEQIACGWRHTEVALSRSCAARTSTAERSSRSSAWATASATPTRRRSGTRAGSQDGSTSWSPTACVTASTRQRSLTPRRSTRTSGRCASRRCASSTRSGPRRSARRDAPAGGAQPGNGSGVRSPGT
jgi:hypothetical protein